MQRIACFKTIMIIVTFCSWLRYCTHAKYCFFCGCRLQINKPNSLTKNRIACLHSLLAVKRDETWTWDGLKSIIQKLKIVTDEWCWLINLQIQLQFNSIEEEFHQ